ncbi:MAG: aldehyde dehydrogenase family protein [Sphingobium sp.]
MSCRLLIDGRLVDGERSGPVVNPATGQPFADAPRAGRDQVEQAVAAANRAFPVWSATSVEQRAAAIGALADAVAARADALAPLLTREQGKPIAEARGEIALTVEALRYHMPLRLPPRTLAADGGSMIVEQRYPLGVVAAIVPANYPLLLLALKLAPALIAGNVVIAKPAATTPLTTLMLGELAADLFPPGVVQIVSDADDVGPLLTAHPGIAHISFTGTTARGRQVMAAAAGTIKRLTLELGGNDAALLLPGADVGAIAPGLFAGAMANAGQSCLAIKRVYAPRAMMDDLCDAMAREAARVVPGDGLDPATTMGPVHRADQRDRLNAMLDEAKRRGQVVNAPAPVPQSGYFIAPAIVRDLPDDAALVREEQFGPLLPVLAYDREDEAIARINDSPYGLSASLWGARDHALALAARIQCGTVWVNRHMDLPFAMPLGGAKQSGFGRHQGIEGVMEFTQARIVNAGPD